MNQGYYRPPTTSRASATTKCQKCLKLDMSFSSHVPTHKLTINHGTTATNAKQNLKSVHMPRDLPEQLNSRTPS